MSSLRGAAIEPADPRQNPTWDAQVLSCFPAANSFYSAAWATVLSSTYGYTPQYLLSRAQDQIQLLLPIIEIRSWLTGVRAVSLPFTDECDALYTNPEFLEPLFPRLLQLAEQRRWKYYELRGRGPFLQEPSPSLSFHGHRLLLDPDPAKLFADCYGTVRTSVRKAEQQGVRVEFSASLEATRAFYSLLCKTRGRHGLPPQPPALFENIQREILQKNQGTVALAKAGSDVVAGAVFFHFGKTAIYKYAASDDRFRHLQGNNLVLWKGIEHYAGENFSVLDFGRTSLANQGLRKFKLSWNTRESRLDYFRYHCPTRSLIKTADQAASGLHTRFFQSLPEGLSRLIGKAVYKHLG